MIRKRMIIIDELFGSFFALGATS